MPPNGLQLNLFDAASDASNEVAKSARKSAAVSDKGECSFIYRYILRESCSQFASLPLTSLTIFAQTKEVAAVSDTVVMQNLGYFQLQAAPGRWRIRLAEGRATDLFELATRPRAEGTAAATFHEVLLHDFVGSARMTKLVVRKQLGKELDELLETVKDGGSGSGSESEGGASLWSKVSSLVTGKKKKPTKKSVALAAAGGDAAAVAAAKEEEETVHVFSLASGHLYERLMRIMMLSVTKRTSAPVKFWLVENFLSPHFKSTVFAMAKEFGFQVELITYVARTKRLPHIAVQHQYIRTLTPSLHFHFELLCTSSQVQVARVAAAADGEAADYLGLQDSLPRCSLPPRCAQNHLRRRRSSCPGRFKRALGARPARRAVRLHADVQNEPGDGGLPVLGAGLLEGASPRQAVPHQRPLRR